MKEKIGKSILRKPGKEGLGKDSIGFHEFQQQMRQKQQTDRVVEKLIEDGLIPEPEHIDPEIGYPKETYDEVRELMKEYKARNLYELGRKIQEAEAEQAQVDREERVEALVEEFKKPTREVKEVAKARGVSFTTADQIIRKEKERKS